MNKKGNWSHIQKMKGHKSGLETRIDEQLKAQGIDGEYEQHEVSYTVPEHTTLTNPISNYQTVSTLNQRVGFYPRTERNIYSSENRILRWIYDLFYSPQTVKYTKVLKLLTLNGVRRMVSNGLKKKYPKNGLTKNKRKISLIFQNNFVY